MTFIDDMKIGKKLIGGFVIVLILLGIVAVVGYTAMEGIKTNGDSMYNDRLVPIKQLSAIDADIMQMRGDWYRYAYIPDSRASIDASMPVLIADMDKNWADYKASYADANEKALQADFETKYAAVKANGAQLMADVKAGKTDAVNAAFATGSPLVTSRTDASAALDKIEQLNVDQADGLMTTSAKEGDAATMELALAALIAAIIGIGLALYLSKSITGPIDDVKRNLNELSLGHLGNRMKANRKDEIGEMAETMDRFSEDLQKNVVGSFQRIAQGDLTVMMAPKDANDEITPAIMQTVTSLNGLVDESKMLSKAAVEGRLDTRGNTDKFKGGYKEIVGGVNNTLDAVIGPLNVAAEYVDRISKGDVPAKITDNYNGDFNEIKNNLNQCIDAVNLLVKDANMLSKAAVEGKLDTRADASKHQGDFRKIVQGVDDCLDAVIGPLNVAAEYVDRISKGDIPAKITDNYNGDFNEIKNNLNQCIDAVNHLVADANMLSKAAVEGKLDTRADASKHQGDFKKIVQGVDDCLDAVIGPLNVAAEYVDRISKGDIPPKITDNYNGDFNEIKNNLNQCVDVMNGLLVETDTLIKATQDGKLQTRGNAQKFPGGWGTLVGGVNNLIDAFVHPIDVTSSYVDRISKGDIPPKITDNYNGDFNVIKNNLNQCVDVMNGLLAETDTLIKATKEGKLQTRGNAQKFPGGWGTLVGGVNELIDAFVHPINVTADYVDRISKGDIPAKITDNYNGDFNLIKSNLNTCIDAVNLLVNDANMLSEAAVAGKLATRADGSKHQGDFRKIVDGVNQTLDSVIDPVNEAMRISDQYAKQNFSARVDENLKVQGDFIRFKKSLNNVGIQVSRAMIKVNEQVNELAAGAQEASASVEEVAAGSNQIAKNAGAVSVNADKSGAGIQQVLKAMEDLSTTVQEVATKADLVAQLAKKSEDLSQKGSELANKADKGMGGITKSSTEVNEIILDIKSQMDKIGDIVVLIANLANQTNLLALNAAIEAARAGDAGRGFAVVATEVKSLAEESENSAEKIRQMIGQLQKQTQRAVDAVDKANEGVREGSTALTQTLEVFNKIVESINDINKNISDVAASAEEQAASVEEVTASVNAVSSLVNDTAKEATDAAAASEESSAAIDQIAKVVQNVTTIVDSVTREISAFKVADNDEANLAAAGRDYQPSTASAQ